MSTPQEAAAHGASPEKVYYSKFKDAGSFWVITWDDGARQGILCTGMFEWQADWLIEQVQGKPLPEGH